MMERAPAAVLPVWWHGHLIPKYTHNKAIGYFGRRSREGPTKRHIYLHLICQTVCFPFPVWDYTSRHCNLVVHFHQGTTSIPGIKFWKTTYLLKNPNTEWACVAWVSSCLFQWVKLRFLFDFIAQSVKEPNIDSLVLETDGNSESQ